MAQGWIVRPLHADRHGNSVKPYDFTRPDSAFLIDPKSNDSCSEAKVAQISQFQETESLNMIE
jgi:hypothetical protein